MNKTLIAAMLGVATLLTASAASATTININFDSLPLGLISPGAFPDVVFTNADVVLGGGFEASPPNAIISNSSGFSFGLADAVGVHFNTPASFASIVGLNVGFNGLEVDAFNAANTLIGSASVFGTTVGGTAPPDPPGETFTVSVSAAGIDHLLIYQPITSFDDTIVLDNFSAVIGPTAVPEPASLTLLGIGLATAAVRRRRRR